MVEGYWRQPNFKDDIMKLLKGLYGPALHQSIPSQAVLTRLGELDRKPSTPVKQPQLDNFDDNEHIGVGAVMVQDVAGMEFLDSGRRRIPDIHDGFPPHGMAYEYAEEPES